MELVQRVARYPQAGERVRVLHEQSRPGGGAFEMLSALRRLDADLPLYALGLIGDDENGRALLAASHKLEIDTFQLQVIAAAATARAHVVHAADNGSSTSFYLSGANDLLAAEHFDFPHCLAQWFHLGDYEAFERLHLPAETCGSVAGKIFHAARAAGLVTALTLCSHEMPANARALLPGLDYLILTEPALMGHALHSAPRNLKITSADFFAHGLHRGLAILGAERGFAMLSSGEHAELERAQTADTRHISLPAFSAAFLYGQYSGKELESCLANALAEEK
jgi:sugar/nucleoside kinase (ribokinase family)